MTIEIEIEGPIVYWRGPAPWYFVAIPDDESEIIRDEGASYGWGCVAVGATIGSTDWTTSLMPKDGRYLLPLRADIRRKEHLDEAMRVTVRLRLDAP